LHALQVGLFMMRSFVGPPISRSRNSYKKAQDFASGIDV